MTRRIPSYASVEESSWANFQQMQWTQQKIGFQNQAEHAQYSATIRETRFIVKTLHSIQNVENVENIQEQK